MGGPIHYIVCKLHGDDHNLLRVITIEPVTFSKKFVGKDMYRNTVTRGMEVQFRSNGAKPTTMMQSVEMVEEIPTT